MASFGLGASAAGAAEAELAAGALLADAGRDEGEEEEEGAPWRSSAQPGAKARSAKETATTSIDRLIDEPQRRNIPRGFQSAKKEGREYRKSRSGPTRPRSGPSNRPDRRRLPEDPNDS